MSGADQLRAALARKNGLPDPKPVNRVPNPIRHAAEGLHVAQDGKPYMIAYEQRLPCGKLPHESCDEVCCLDSRP